jgi:hypothetical protein
MFFLTVSLPGFPEKAISSRIYLGGGGGRIMLLMMINSDENTQTHPYSVLDLNQWPSDLFDLRKYTFSVNIHWRFDIDPEISNLVI